MFFSASCLSPFLGGGIKFSLLIIESLCFVLYFFLCDSNEAVGEMCPGKGVC